MAYGETWKPPKLPPAWEYGNILIKRTSLKSGVKPVSFSHWLHRQRHTCRVCHFELEFNMRANTTEITEADNRAGGYCGTNGCHDGKTAFGHDKPNCGNCHNDNIAYGRENFAKLSGFPKTDFGDGIDWVKALQKHMIKPAHYLTIKPVENLRFGETLSYDIKGQGIFPAIFPHKEHIQWLDCNNCHPEIFNIKKKTTKNFEMARILKGEFCGVCHLSVSFPINDCKRCHREVKK